MNPYMRVVGAILATFGAGSVGFLFVDTDVSGWYATLQKPLLNPPDSVFIVVWLFLYTLMSAAFAIIWTKEPQTEQTAQWVRFYFIQLLFNAMWTFLFFGFHTIILAFFDILFLNFIVLGLIAGACTIDKRAAYLLAPYMAWLLFAAYLNVGLWFLN